MIARLLVAAGATAAAVGFMFLGIGQSTPDDLDWMVSAGWFLLPAGIVVAALGAAWYRSTEKAAEAMIAHQAARTGKEEPRQAG